MLCLFVAGIIPIQRPDSKVDDGMDESLPHKNDYMKDTTKAGETGMINEHILAVSLSGGTTAVIKSDHCLWMWGYNEYGQIGTGTTEEVLIPCKVMNDVMSVCADDINTVAVKTDGSLWFWGEAEYGVIGNEGKEMRKQVEEQNCKLFR